MQNIYCILVQYFLIKVYECSKCLTEAATVITKFKDDIKLLQDKIHFLVVKGDIHPTISSFRIYNFLKKFNNNLLISVDSEIK